jgi:hypothetical protein
MEGSAKEQGRQMNTAPHMAFALHNIHHVRPQWFAPGIHPSYPIALVARLMILHLHSLIC